ncbi:expansin-like A1 [Prunus dulcis]|uniref:Expansin-like A1 n=1 Tax=Prunus dulcis TaxID=3755 RepID=A0A4Y1S105_PRUDU|nr:expansin-like A1 [Prunus dulcis]
MVPWPWDLVEDTLQLVCLPSTKMELAVIRCKNTTLCTKQGTRVTLTDLNKSNQTDFVLSSRAFMAMAQKGLGQDILRHGIVDVEYKRVPCEYKNQNLALRVEESSQKPHYLAIKILYQGGQTEIVAIDVAQVGSSNWGFLTRNNGAIWDTSRVPAGGLQFRFLVTAGYDGKTVWAQNVLPANWKPGMIYDTKFKSVTLHKRVALLVMMGAGNELKKSHDGQQPSTVAHKPHIRAHH